MQGSLGEGIFTGLPLMLSGMRKTLEAMDWQSLEGQMYQGILVNDIIDRRTGEVAFAGTASRSPHHPPAHPYSRARCPRDVLGACLSM